jgi:hypothetical protein
MVVVVQEAPAPVGPMRRLVQVRMITSTVSSPLRRHAYVLTMMILQTLWQIMSISEFRCLFSHGTTVNISHSIRAAYNQGGLQ